MFKSIFKKQISLYLLILTISFSICAVLINNNIRNYFTKSATTELEEQGEKIAKRYEHAYKTGIMDISDLDKLYQDIQILEDYMNTKAIIIDSNGYINYTSDSIDPSIIGKSISQDNLKKALDGEIVYNIGKFSGAFKENMITVGYPIKLDKLVLGAVFMNRSMPEIEEHSNDILNIIVIALLIALLASFMLIFISTKAISKPLDKIMIAADKVSKGDFSSRIEITSKDQVAELAETFNNMTESLDKQEQIKRDFISNVSHDIRSPLTTIQAYITAMIDGTIVDDKEKYLNIVLKETKRLAKLSNNILELNKAEIYDLNDAYLSSFDLNKLVRDCIENFEISIKNKNIDFILNFELEEQIVRSDYDKVMRILYNILDNAVKFVNDSGQIVLESKKIRDKIHLSVFNTGSYINPDEQKNMFKRFYKGDKSRGYNKQSGGLGLSIVKEFIKILDEEIIIDSDKDKGSKITFTLSIDKKEV